MSTTDNRHAERTSPNTLLDMPLYKPHVHYFLFVTEFSRVVHIVQ